MANPQREPRDPARADRRIALTPQQRDRIIAAAAALEAHAGRDKDPLALLLSAAELRRVAGDWDAAGDSRPAEPAEPGLRQALRQIANAESGIWGWIAQRALDEHDATSSDNTAALGDKATGTPAIPGDAWNREP